MNIPVFSITSENDFTQASIKIFEYQAANNQVYAKYLSYLGFNKTKVNTISDIPFLPVSFFKTEKVVSYKTNPNREQMVFSSSGTTGMQTSRHYVYDISVYEQSFITGFTNFYGPAENLCILALLPSYTERSGSSLVYMVDKLIQLSGCEQSGYFLSNYPDLIQAVANARKLKKNILLLGVSFALLDLAEYVTSIDFSDVLIMETGGMKGRRKEMVRAELHEILKHAFNVKDIHSEYGMTELLSQAYSKGNGIYNTQPWMKVLIRDIYDPFSYMRTGQSGGVNVIDLANYYSCSFIETQDIGKIISDKGDFIIEGRFDNSDIRGCNLLVS